MGHHGDRNTWTGTARRTVHRPPTARERRQRRLARLCLRVLLPLTVAALLTGLALAAYASLAGGPASYSEPYRWDGGEVYLSGGPIGDGAAVYTDCLVRPDVGDVRTVRVPSGGVRAEAWFTGEATVTCGRSVAVTSGPQLLLYPFALNRSALVALALAAVVLCWCGYRLNVASRGPRPVGPPWR